MATSLTAKPVRYVGSNTRYTGLPILPSNTAHAEPGDVFPHARAIRRSSNIPSNGAMQTWIAQAHSGAVKIAIKSAAGAVVSGYVVDPTVVDWANVTRTCPLPDNPNGGILRFNFLLGTAHYTTAGLGSQTQSVIEERQLLLTVPNTWTEARKLPPLTPVSLANPVADNIYESGTLGAVYDSGTEQPKAFRWLGGAVKVGAFYPSPTPATLSIDVYAIPINPFTLSGNWANRQLVGSFTATPFTLVSRTFTPAELIAAGVVRWEQFWLVAIHFGGAPGGSVATYSLYSPVDIPPPYDCPGVDGYLPGGFL